MSSTKVQMSLGTILLTSDPSGSAFSCSLHNISDDMTNKKNSLFLLTDEKHTNYWKT